MYRTDNSNMCTKHKNTFIDFDTNSFNVHLIVYSMHGLGHLKLKLCTVIVTQLNFHFIFTFK